MSDEKVKKKVLVAEDESGVRRLLHGVLSAVYDTRAAQNGETALEVWRDFNPDLVLTDYLMDKVDGYTLIERMMEGGYAGKRVLMSGRPGDAYNDHPHLKTDFDHYFDGFVQKPFRPSALLAELSRVLGEPESQ